MKTRPRWINTLSSAMLLVGMATAWVIFAPMQFGGQVAYVIVNGNSMVPLYQPGDLVIVHRAAEFQVGDIVTYHHPDIGPVIHRIIGQLGDQYIMKGDHNTWTDSFLPTQADIIGRAWIHLAGVGKIFGTIRTPWVLSLLVASIAGVLLITIIPAPRQERTRRDRRARKGQRAPMKIKTRMDHWDDWLFVLVVLALAALALVIAGFTHPVSRTVSKDVQYQQKGVFSYSSPQSAGLAVYGTNGLQTGEPVFHQLINRVSFRFDYQFVANSPMDIQGSATFLARLSAADGWEQTLVLQPATSFKGSTVSVSGSLDLDALQAILDNLQTQTGIQRQNYMIDILPQVSLKGSLGTQAFSENFAPFLQFQIDPLEMQLVRSDPTGPDPLNPSTSGLLKQPFSTPNTISLLGLQLKVLAARWISMVVLLLSLGGLAVLMIPLFRGIPPEDEPARIQRRFGLWLVSVSKGLPGKDEPVKDLETIDDLARLAEREGRSILHAVKGQNHIYFVPVENYIYRYIASGVKEEKQP